MIRNTILYIGGFELPDKNAAAQRVMANAKIFRDLNYKVVLIGVDKTLNYESNIEDTFAIVSSFETWSIPYPKNIQQWVKHLTSVEYLKNILKKYDENNIHSIICYNYPAIGLLNVKKICEKIDAKFIPDTTEWYESSGGGVLFNSIKWIDTSLRMRVVQKKADALITTSPYLTNYYFQTNINILELPTLYDVQELKIIPLNLDKKKDTVKLLYAGSAFNPTRIDKNRNNIKDRLDKIIILLAEVYAYNKNFILDIYGLTKENYLLVFWEHAMLLDKLAENIVFHGRKPHGEIIKHIQQSDFTIFIRNTERVIEAGFPSKFSESISYGTPVVSNMISNIKPYAREGKNHFEINLDDNKEQLQQMLKILSLNASETKKTKSYCSGHKIFDYRQYINSTELFFTKLEKKV